LGTVRAPTPVRLQKLATSETRPVGIGAFQPVACEGAIDEFRIDLAEFLIAETGSFQSAGPDIGQNTSASSTIFLSSF
jgi:hypothetical protein